MTVVDEAIDYVAEGEAEILKMLSPEYAAAYREFQRVARRRNALTPAERELVMLAVNSAIHLYDLPGVRFHMRRALAAGATPDQVLGVMRGGQGQRTFQGDCTDFLLEELEAAGAIDAPTEELLASEKEFNDWVVKLRGFGVGRGWRSMMRLDQEFLGAYQILQAASISLLEPRLAELVIIATDVATTNLNADGARTHIKRALSIGVTKDELIEVYEIVTMVSYKTLFMGASVLRDELANVSRSENPLDRSARSSG